VTVALVLAATGAVHAQPPAINYRGVVNAASLMPQGLPGGGIAQGSIFTIFGRNLGPATPAAAAGFPLSTTLSGVSIKVFQGAKSVDAIPLFVSTGQITAVMPSNTPLGMVSVQLSRNNAKSNPAPVRVVANTFGIFTANSTGMGPGTLQNFVAQNQQPENNLMAPATSGQTITMWGTGLGPVSGADNVAPTAGNLSAQVEVFVGGQSATVKYAGRSACCSGVDQIAFTVPSNAPLGCWVPVMVRTGGTTVSNAVTMAISSDGSPCSEPANPLAQAFIAGGRVGTLQLLRSSTHEDIGTLSPVDVATDLFSFDLAQATGGPFVYSPLFSQPPAGSCTVFTAAGDYWGTGSLPTIPTVAKRLEAGGSFSMTGPKGTSQLKPADPSLLAAFLGSYAPFLPGLPNQLTLAPGNYTFAAPGGADVGSFQASVTVAPPFTWTNRDQLNIVDRTKPLTLAWSGLPQGQTIAILGGNVDLPTNSSGVFYCVASANAASFTIPPAILAAVPPTQANVLKSKSVIYLTTVAPSNGAPFSAPGLDSAVAVAGYLSGKTVFFQ
jgi:uncharacterized protein (TIGR03437 family)